ncbi:MAG: TetR/AcrR family transcriptional regulator [Spirochaetales bacterium]|nr:TetR/AcrR family transcriptional regulator [Spirochaetales bacterium]
MEVIPMPLKERSRLEQKKTLILDATKELLIKHGKRVSMASIAKAMDLEPSSLYYYFKSIPEIIDTILDNEYHDFRLSNIRFKDIDVDPLSVLKDMMRMILEFYYDNLSILQIILSQVLPLSIDEDYKEDSVAINHFLKTYREANKSLEDAIKRAQKKGQLTKEYSSWLILNTIRGYIFGLYAAWREEKPQRESISSLVENFLSLYTR